MCGTGKDSGPIVSLAMPDDAENAGVLPRYVQRSAKKSPFVLLLMEPSESLMKEDVESKLPQEVTKPKLSQAGF